ncbi:unnamed protein product [Effrenium voratum]|nr:unnamed protein product [Effrenium voratum]
MGYRPLLPELLCLQGEDPGGRAASLQRLRALHALRVPRGGTQLCPHPCGGSRSHSTRGQRQRGGRSLGETPPAVDRPWGRPLGHSHHPPAAGDRRGPSEEKSEEVTAAVSARLSHRGVLRGSSRRGSAGHPGWSRKI